MIVGFSPVLLIGVLLLRIRKRYAKAVVGSSHAYWEVVDVFLNRRRSASQLENRLQVAERQRRQLEVFFLILGALLVVLGVVGFLGLIPRLRNP